MPGANALIEQYQLQPHPEGGFYRSTYRSPLTIPRAALPLSFNGDRPVATAIYFLLRAGDYSAFHRLRSDECWHFYQGDPLWIHCIDEAGHYHRYTLGPSTGGPDCHYQLVVRAGVWFASEPATHSAYSFVGCTVSPGFDFAEFEMAQPDHLVRHCPGQASLIHARCRSL